jgi:Ca2+-binding RTX toxin-like protein
MRATFTAAIDFADFDISSWPDRTAVPSLATGSFTLGGTTYENRYLMPFAAGSDAYTLNLLGNDLTGSRGVLDGGTIGAIRLFAEPSGGPALLSLQGLNLSARALHDALRSAGTSDDRAILAEILAGNDEIILSDGADRAFGGNGNDTLSGNGGGDVLAGGNGKDWMYGGDGRDSLNGQVGADRLSGGAASDRLVGGLGNDVLAGGAGADTFRFTSNDGNDVIRDFQDDVDTIDIDILPSGKWQVDLQPHDGDTVLTVFRFGNPDELLGLRIVIENVDPTQVTDDILL